jgi:hypothetical protein
MGLLGSIFGTFYETPCRKPVPKPILYLWQRVVKSQLLPYDVVFASYNLQKSGWRKVRQPESVSATASSYTKRTYYVIVSTTLCAWGII